MHRFHSSSAINRIRLVSVLLCLKYVGAAAATSLVVYSLVEDNGERLVAGAVIGVAAFLALLTEWMFAEKTRCPLCLTPVLKEKSCSKHRHAKTFLGSFRLRVALAVMVKGSFRCPYCNEPSVLKVRAPRR